MENRDFCRYCKENILSIPRLTEEEEKKMLIEIKAGNKKIRKEFIERNLYLVVRHVFYVNPQSSYEEMYSCGCVGLLNAVEQFDISNEIKFSSYALYWIKSSIKYYGDIESKMIRLSSGFRDKMRAYIGFFDYYMQDNSCSPSINEIIQGTGLSNEDVFKCELYKNSFLSLDSPIDSDTDVTFMQLIPDSYDFVESIDMSYDFNNALVYILEKCNFPEESIEMFNLYFGFNNNNPHTYSEIGDVYGMTHQAVYSRINSMLKRLKKNERFMKMISTYNTSENNYRK